MRPFLRPGLRWAWRSPDTIQFGVDVPQPLVVTGLSSSARDLLPLLDGSRTATSLVAALDAPVSVVDIVLERLLHFGVLIDGRRWPGGRGLTPEGLARLLPDHRVAGTLPRFRADPASRFDQLARTRVVVEGLSRLGAIVWTSLTAAGVARVDAHDTGASRPATSASAGSPPRRSVVSDLSSPPCVSRGSLARPRATSSRACTSSPMPSTSRRAVAAWWLLGHPTSSSPARSGSDAWDPWSSLAPLHVTTASPWPVATLTPAGPRCGGSRPPHPNGHGRVARRHDGPPGHLARPRVDDGREPTTLTGQLELTAPEGSVRLLPVARHPECGCAWPDLAG